MKVLKIGAVWCSGCLIMGPRWKEIEKENPWLETQYYDFDSSEDIINLYHLEDTKLPTFIFLNGDNEEIDRATGEISKKNILDLINKYKDR